MPKDHNSVHKAVLLNEYSDRGDNAEYRHSAVEIALPLRGSLTAVCSHGDFLLNQNDMILIPADGAFGKSRALGAYACAVRAVCYRRGERAAWAYRRDTRAV